MKNKHKLFILGLLLSLCLCGCGKTSDQKSDFEYQLLDGWVENKVDNTLFFTPNAYKVGSEATCAKYMISAGYIQKINTSDDWGKIKDGKIQQVYFNNHSNVEDYDLYSAAALEKEKNNGTNILEIDQTGQYWVLYLVKENKKTGYILALNTRNYTKEDMIEWAKSFKF